MSRNRCYNLLLLLFIGLVANAHPIKMTVSKLTLNTETKEMSYAINLFIDDLQPVLKKHYPYEKWDFNQLSDNEVQTLTGFINDYITITVNKRGVILHRVTVSNIEENVCQVRFEDTLDISGQIESLSLLNVILLEDYSSQSNIVHVIIDDSNRKTYRLEKGDAYFEISNLFK